MRQKLRQVLLAVLEAHLLSVQLRVVQRDTAPQPSRPSSPSAPKHVQKLAPDKTHGNSLSSQKPTWVYRLRSNSDGSLLKNGITSKAVPEKRYTKDFMKDKYMDAYLQPNRKAAYDTEYQLNLVQPGPLNKNLH